MSEITTERLRGRPCTPGDVPLIGDLFCHSEVTDWTSPPGIVWSQERFEMVAMRLSAHWLCHGWGPRVWFEGTRFVGVLGLQFSIIAGRGAVEIAFAVLPEEQRKGYAGEALKAALAEAPDIATHVTAAVREGNGPSLRLLRRSGFRDAGASVEDGRRLLLLDWQAG